MPRDPIPTWFFVLVDVRLWHRFLLVHERKHGQLWYLPAGRVEAGESFFDAAKRETMEEAGVPIEIGGILRVEYSSRPDGTARCRVILLAHPTDDTPPKQHPDTESLEAGWFSLSDVEHLPLRGAEVLRLLRYVDQGPMVVPCSFLVEEGASY